MTIFIAGTYGVGKSTICNLLSKNLNIPYYSAGDLISEVNGEEYGANKTVQNKSNNQDILISAVNEKSKTSNNILLAGHFCIFDSDNKVDLLPEFVFGEINIGAIVVLEADCETIVNHLFKRDDKQYPLSSIKELQRVEHNQAKRISSEIGVPLLCHKMLFDGTDVNIISQWIERCI